MITEIVAQSSDRLCQIYPDSHAAYTSSSKFCDFYQDEMAPQAKIPKKKKLSGVGYSWVLTNIYHSL